MTRFTGNAYEGILDWFVDEDEITGEYQALKETVATEYANLKQAASAEYTSLKQSAEELRFGMTILIGSATITAVGIILICLILLFKK